MEWYEILIEILKGLIIIIPLVIKLIEYVKKSAKGENWTDLMTLVVNLMKEAEDMFEYGADKKMWVMSMVSASSKTLNYPVDLEQVSAWIDALCDMSKVVNAPVKE